MLASRQGEEHRILWTGSKNHLRICRKKGKNRERGWCSLGAELVRTWCGEGGGRFALAGLTLRFPKNEWNVLLLEKKVLYLHPQIEQRFFTIYSA